MRSTLNSSTVVGDRVNAQLFYNRPVSIERDVLAGSGSYGVGQVTSALQNKRHLFQE
jgi:hypothetical protein